MMLGRCSSGFYDACPGHLWSVDSKFVSVHLALTEVTNQGPGEGGYVGRAYWYVCIHI